MFLKDIIRYKQIKFISAEKSPLFGTPGPETDAAWDRLIDDASLRLSQPELARFNSSSIDLQDSPGKLAWLEVSHQIHCVVSKNRPRVLFKYARSEILVSDQDYIRKAINRNHYFAELSDSDWRKYINPHVGMFYDVSSRQ